MPGATPRLIRQLRSGTADLGLLTLPVDDPALVSVPVMREELLLVTAPHASAGAQEADHAAGSGASAVRAVRGRVGHAARRSRSSSSREHIAPTVVTETENVEIIKAMVRIGMGDHDHPVSGGGARGAKPGQLFCARIAGQQLVRETGWVHLKLNRVPRAGAGDDEDLRAHPLRAQAIAWCSLHAARAASHRRHRNGSPRAAET